MTGGPGSDTFSFQFGGGSQDTITGFSAKDTLQLSGFGISTVPTQTVNGSTVIGLSDGTTITISGVPSINPNQIVLK
jgi:Ca2+-binding RTX toxin-like protein